MIDGLNPFSARKKIGCWFWIRLTVVAALVLWLWLQNQLEDEKKPSVKSFVLPTDDVEITSPPVPKSVPRKPDDLKKIEGIGPKIASVLPEAGITTFAQLAAMQPDQIKHILRSAGVRIGYTETWPEQAALAAAEKWDELEELQDTLKGGRRARVRRARLET